MTDFPRTLPPNHVSALWLPTGLRRRSHSGRIQLRTTQQIGWVWSETWTLLNIKDADDAALLAFIRNSFNRQTIFDIEHQLSAGSGLDRFSTVTPAGSITVDGASQTGSALATAGWPVSTADCVKAGELISVESRLYEVSADASSDVNGDVSIPVTPNIFNSPTNGATVTIEGVKIRAMIWSLPRFRDNRPPNYYSFTVGFAEVVP